MKDLVWSSTANAMYELARAAGLPCQAPGGSADIEAMAEDMGLEAEPVDSTYADVDATLRDVGPALVSVEGGVVALLRGRVLAPDGSRRDTCLVRDALVASLEAGVTGEIDRVVALAQIPERRRPRVRAALLRERLGSARLPSIWMLRIPASAPLLASLRAHGAWAKLAAVAVLHTAIYGIVCLGWWLLGRAALEGRLDHGWLWGWALLLATQQPLSLIVTWVQGILALDVAALLKLRLLSGALALPQDDVKTRGAGALLGRVLESEAIESLAMSGGLVGVMAIIELAAAAIVLTFAPGHNVLALALWILAMAAFALVAYRRRDSWTLQRLALTHDLVEGMIGHRTRLAFERRDRWHDDEDGALAQYAGASRGMDRAHIATSLMPRGWVVIALLGIASSFVGGGASPATLAVAVGGILLAQRGLTRMNTGLASILGAHIAWRTVAPIFRAARRRRSLSHARPDGAVLEARGMTFRYPARAQPVLSNATLRITDARGVGHACHAAL